MGREKFLPCGPSYIDYRLFAFLFSHNLCSTSQPMFLSSVTQLAISLVIG